MSIVSVAVFWLLAMEAWEPLKQEADEQVVNATAQQATDWIGIGMTNYLLITLGFTVLGMLVFSVYSRQGGF